MNNKPLTKLKAKRRQVRRGKIVTEIQTSKKYTKYESEESQAYGFLIPTKKSKLGTEKLVQRFLRMNKDVIESTTFGKETSKENRERILTNQILQYKKIYGLNSRQALARIIETTYNFKSAEVQGPINFIEGLKNTPCHDYNDEPIDEYSSYEYVCMLLNVDYLEPSLVKYEGDNEFTYAGEISLTLTGGKGESQYYIIKRV